MQKSLKELLSQLAIERAIGAGCQQQYLTAINNLAGFLGYEPTAADLTEVTVNTLILQLEKTYSTATVKNRKAGILVMWNYSAELGLCAPYHSKRIRKVRLTLKPPQSLSMDEVSRLLDAARSISGRLSIGLDGSLVAEIAILFALQAGLRAVDIRHLERSQIDAAGVFTFIQQKTGQLHCAQVTKELVNLCDYSGALNRSLILPVSKDSLRHWCDKAFERAGLKGVGVGLKALRKTHATMVAERDGLEAASRSLGHVSGTEVARKHYIAPRALLKPAKPVTLKRCA